MYARCSFELRDDKGFFYISRLQIKMLDRRQGDQMWRFCAIWTLFERQALNSPQILALLNDFWIRAISWIFILQSTKVFWHFGEIFKSFEPIFYYLGAKIWKISSTLSVCKVFQKHPKKPNNCNTAQIDRRNFSKIWLGFKLDHFWKILCDFSIKKLGYQVVNRTTSNMS